jgi:23S rRNA (cytidine1920-2'-O)/16S rRNA (cytidine1409-2'-O)-methyltransferase
MEKAKKNKRKLIDVLLEKYLELTKEVALPLIMEGKVKVDGRNISKPGSLVDAKSVITIEKNKKYVSKGGIKIEGAVHDLGIPLESKTAMDVGASTGGFSDYLLKNGVTLLIAVDVGYGIFDWKIRNMKNVHLFERTNIKDLKKENLPFLPDIIAVDLSFISVKRIFYKLLELSNKNAQFILLIKPQFEIEKELVQKGGIIKDPDLHIKVLNDFIGFLKDYEVKIKGITFSKIKGAKGNIEFFLYLIKNGNSDKNILYYDKIIPKIVKEAHIYFQQ